MKSDFEKIYTQLILESDDDLEDDTQLDAEENSQKSKKALEEMKTIFFAAVKNQEKAEHYWKKGLEKKKVYIKTDKKFKSVSLEKFNADPEKFIKIAKKYTSTPSETKSENSNNSSAIDKNSMKCEASINFELRGSNMKDSDELRNTLFNIIKKCPIIKYEHREYEDREYDFSIKYNVNKTETQDIAEYINGEIKKLNICKTKLVQVSAYIIVFQLRSNKNNYEV